LQNKNNQYLAEGINLNMSKMQNNVSNNASNKTQTNGPNIMQDNDYYKSLKDVKKEIDKIYNQLSKQETFPEILDNIKKEFLNNNINIIEDYLSKPNLTNYKGFNSKIIKILEILINILESYTYFGDGKSLKGEIEKIGINIVIPDDKKKGKVNISTVDRLGIVTTKIEDLPIAIEQNTIITIISDKFDTEKARLQGFIDSKYKEQIGKEKEKDINKILKCIITLYYYRNIFEKSDDYGNRLDDSIKELAGKIEGYSGRKLNSSEEKELNGFKDELKKAHDNNKKIYRDLFSYLKLSNYDIFESVANAATDKNKKDDKKPNEPVKKDEKDSSAYTEHIQNFKTNIYYNIININNTPSTDIHAQLKESNNAKIDLEARQKVLSNTKLLLDKQLSKLHNIIETLIRLKKDEYSKQIIDIKGIFKDYEKEGEFKDTISLLIVSEENDIVKLIAKNADDIKVYTEQIKTEGKQRGGEKQSTKYYEDKYENIKNLNEKIDGLIKEIRTFEGIEENNDPFDKSNNGMLSADDGIISIYKNIWNDYLKESKKNSKKGATIESIKFDDRLYERVNMNDLDPNKVLKVTFQDKVIFICIILIIRTFAMVLIEFLIEHNIISTLYRSILVYSLLYILLIIFSIFVINYDSYKLRILVNYLNLHINSSNIFFHIMLFIIFIGLILIIISNNENSLKNIDNVFNYTYIYKYVYEIAEKSNASTSELLLSQKDKIKLQYRMDILTMIVFIFSALLILIM
jgi:hypothetical protein